MCVCVFVYACVLAQTAVDIRGGDSACEIRCKMKMEIMSLCKGEYKKIKCMREYACACVCVSTLNNAHKCQLTALSTQEACVES